MSYRCEDFPCCGHYDEGGDARGIPYCPDPDADRRARNNLYVPDFCNRCGYRICECDVDVYPPEESECPHCGDLNCDNDCEDD